MRHVWSASEPLDDQLTEHDDTLRDDFRAAVGEQRSDQLKDGVGEFFFLDINRDEPEAMHGHDHLVDVVAAQVGAELMGDACEVLGRGEGGNDADLELGG